MQRLVAGKEPWIRPEFRGLRIPVIDLILAGEFLFDKLKELDAKRGLTPVQRRARAVDLDQTAKELKKTFFSMADAHGLILLPPEEAAQS
jgi:hypothetical protein